MAKNLKLIHLANCNSTNIGNGALITGLENLISEDFKAEIEWVREAWDDYTFGIKYFDEQFVDLVNHSNGLIINGAVTIHGREYLRENGMRFELPLSLVKKVKKPIVFYGISYRHFHGQVFHHAEVLRKTFRGLTEFPNVLMGVRNDGTRIWLKKTLKLDPDTLAKIYEIPDTGVFTYAKPGQYPEILDERKVIIFAPNDEDAPFRFGQENIRYVQETGYQLSKNNNSMVPDKSWRKTRSQLIEQLRNALTRILRESGAQLLLVPHYLDDYKFIASLVDAFEPQIAHQSSISTGLMRVQGTGYFYGRYQRADLAISMRVHSISPCIGLGVPMIPLVTQPRMWDFLKATSLEDLGLDAFSDNLEQDLIDSALRILKNPQERIDKFREARTEMREIARLINARIEEMFD